MSVLPLLSESEKYQFDHPPLLAAEDKSLYFSVSKETEGKMALLSKSKKVTVILVSKELLNFYSLGHTE